MPAYLPKSDSAVAKLQAPEAGEARFWSEEVQGLFLRLRPGGSATWIVKYNVGSVQRRVTLGRFPALSLGMANKAARELLARTALGEDVAVTITATKAAAAAPKAVEVTFGDVVGLYLTSTKGDVTEAYWKDNARYLQRDLAALADTPAAAITTEAIAAALDAVPGTTARNRARAAVSGLLKFAASRGYLQGEVYFMFRLGKAKPETPRERVLSFAELAAVWAAAGDGTQGGRIVRLLLLSGQRRSQFGGLTADEVITDAATPYLNFGAGRMKAGKAHAVPLTPRMTALLPKGEGTLFGKGETPFSGWSKVKARLDAHAACAGLKQWGLHDLRRSMSTHLNDLPNANPTSIDTLLAHSVGKVSATYNRSMSLEGKLELLGTWEALLADRGVL